MSVCPSELSMHGGESMYVVGHRCDIEQVASGSWNNPRIWSTGKVPTRGDAVYQPPGFDLLVHGKCECASAVAAGDVEILHGAEWWASTITGLPNAHLRAGEKDVRVDFDICLFSQPFEAGDTAQIGNGIVWCGKQSVEFWGGEAEVFSKSGDEAYPERCSIRIRHAEGDIKPHVMLMHGSGTFRGVWFDGLGRTDKSKLLSPTNPAGRYALHFHRGGEAHESLVRSCVSSGSAGWGIVNHSSHVVSEGCAVVNCYGAGFVDEACDEVGRRQGCLSLGITSGEGPNYWLAPRASARDRWFGGEGFVSAARTENIDCVAVDVATGFAHFGSALPEVIGGQTVQQRYDDGSATARTPVTLPVRPVVRRYSQFGFWKVWTDFLGEHPQPVLRDGQFAGGGPRSIGLQVSYDGGLIVENCLFQGQGPSGMRDENMSAPITLTDTRLLGFRSGIDSSNNRGGGLLTVRGGAIVATASGVSAAPSQHTDRVIRLDGVEIEAPVDVQTVNPPDAGWIDRVRRHRNEIYVDGERRLYPWQEPGGGE